MLKWVGERILQINSKLKTTFKSSFNCHASLDLDLSNFSIGDIFLFKIVSEDNTRGHESSIHRDT